MDDPGFEIYVESVNIVRSACADDTTYEKLKRGKITKHFVHFPAQVSPGDILHLHQALARSIGDAVEFDIDREELDNGIFVDRLSPSWVKAVASLSNIKPDELQARWAQSYYNEEDQQPEWAAIDLTNVMEKFLQLCRIAVASRTDLVMVWIL